MARIESGSAFHIFAAKYRKGTSNFLVLLSLGNESMFVPLKLYFVSFTLRKFAMGVGALSWKQLPGSNNLFMLGSFSSHYLQKKFNLPLAVLMRPSKTI